MRFSQLVLGLVPLALAAVLRRCAASRRRPGLHRHLFRSRRTRCRARRRADPQFVAASRKDPGNAGFEAFQEIGRPSRFALFEAWHDKAASDAHNKGPAATAFRDKLQSMLVGPFEVRLFDGFSIAGPSAQGGPLAVYVVTHVDVFPAGKDQAAALVTALAEAGRKMPGNLRFDVLQVVGRPNHFTLVQGWRDRKAFDDSLMAAPTRDFRQKLTPLEGALYDERLYHALR